MMASRLPGGDDPSPTVKIASVESWTIDQTAHLLAATSLTPPRPSAPLSIPLDAPPSTPSHLRFTPAAVDPAPRGAHTVHRRSTPIRRDSLARRDLLLKGKEGSRRRQRWENDRLLHVPGAVPPTAADWAVPAWAVRDEYRPTPYALAPLWDGKYAGLRDERVRRARERRGNGGEEDAGDRERVKRELRERMKRAKGARGLLQDLEVEVRDFLMQRLKEAEREGDEAVVDYESDDEIVFVGRGGGGAALKDSAQAARLIFESPEKDQSAGFGRWLVHSIADYYGLDTWSVTTGNPARREAYVGLKTRPEAPMAAMDKLPTPLWVMV